MPCHRRPFVFAMLRIATLRVEGQPSASSVGTLARLKAEATHCL